MTNDHTVSMKTRPLTPLLFVLRHWSLVIFLLLAGCLDYDEDLTVFGNGAGTFAITLAIDEEVLANAPEDLARRFSPEFCRGARRCGG